MKHHSLNTPQLKVLIAQRGQALIEAVFVLIVILGLLFAIQATGQIRTESLDLLGESSYGSFIQSLHRFDRRPPAKSFEKKDSTQKIKFVNQLLHVHEEGLIQVKSHRIVLRDQGSDALRPLGPMSLSRTSYLFVNAGQSNTALETQSRIEQSDDAWRSVTEQTRTLLKSVIEPIRRVDAPWARSPLTTDWLKEWSGQSPATTSTWKR